MSTQPLDIMHQVSYLESSCQLDRHHVQILSPFPSPQHKYHCNQHDTRAVQVSLTCATGADPVSSHMFLSLGVWFDINSNKIGGLILI
jgi:hypothetical protein